MRANLLLALGIALLATGCGEKHEATPESAVPGDTPESAAQAPLEPAFLQHMHLHAEQLDALNFALEDGDLEDARTPAYWLSRHDTVDGIDAEHQEYVYAMRIAAEEVEVATDLETARAAAARISAACQGCHVAAGVDEV